MFAIRHRRVPNVWLGHKFYKRGSDYFPIATELNPSSLKEVEDLYLDDGEFFNDTNYNASTLIAIIDTRLKDLVEPIEYREDTYHRTGILPEPNFVAEDWEVVKLSVSITTLGDCHET